MEADTTTIREEEHRENKRLRMSGNYGKITIVETGTVDVRTDGALIGFFNGLSIYDFAMRFYSDLDDEAKDAAIDFIWEHRDQMFSSEPKPHTLKGDSQSYRISADDIRMLEEDIMVDLELDPVVVKEDIQGEFAEELAQDIAYEIDPHDILLDIAEEMAEKIKDTVQDIESKSELRNIFEHEWWDEVPHVFFEKKSEYIYDEYKDHDIPIEFEEWLLEEVMDEELVIWDIYYDYDSDEWKLKHTEMDDRDRAKRSNDIKRKIKTNDIVEGDGPAILRIRKMSGEIEKTHYVGDAQYFELMNEEDRKQAIDFARVTYECPHIGTDPEDVDDSQTTLA